MGSITRNQWFAIMILGLTVLTGGSAQLTDLIGAYATKLVISFSTLATGFLAGVQIILSGQGAQIQDVRNIALNPSSVQGGAAQKALVEATSAVIGSSAAGPAITKEAQVAILDAAAPLAKNSIIVNKELADATVSPSVKAG